MPRPLAPRKTTTTSIISSFFARRAKKSLGLGRSPPQEIEVGPRSGPYLLVIVIRQSRGLYICRWLYFPGAQLYLPGAQLYLPGAGPPESLKGDREDGALPQTAHRSGGYLGQSRPDC